MNVVIVGPRGSGKTTIARLLAEEYGNTVILDEYKDGAAFILTEAHNWRWTKGTKTAGIDFKLLEEIFENIIITALGDADTGVMLVKTLPIPIHFGHTTSNLNKAADGYFHRSVDNVFNI